MTQYQWRSVQESDLSALDALDITCWQSDGSASIPAPLYRDLLAAHMPMLCATEGSNASDMVAIGWVQRSAAQIRLGGKVHPLHRRQKLGTHLLNWGEAQAELLSQPRNLIIRNETFNDGSAALYAQQGFSVDFVEDWMQRDLHEPITPISTPVSTVSWSADNALKFFEVYHAAFKERPGFPDDSAETWIADYVEDTEFRPDLSLLVLADEKAVGFVTAGELHISPFNSLHQIVGWISQVGVHPAWRGRGIAASLMTSVMQSFKAEGFPALGLHVNTNNPSARRLYDQLGFKVIGQRAKYSKKIAQS